MIFTRPQVKVECLLSILSIAAFFSKGTGKRLQDQFTFASQLREHVRWVTGMFPCFRQHCCSFSEA